MAVYTGFERRSGHDRRRQNSILSTLFSRGLRESSRRAGDRYGIIVFDRYKPLYSFHNQTPKHKLKCYMVILDNVKNNEGRLKKSYPKQKVDNIVKSVKEDWGIKIPKPDIILLSPGNNSFKVSILRRFTSWDDLE